MKVLIIKITSAFFGKIGTIWNKGNGNMYQIGFGSYGVYFSENDFKRIK